MFIHIHLYIIRFVSFVNKAAKINKIIIIDYCPENYLFSSIFQPITSDR